mgnify:CR=1 FL=1
MNYNEYTQPFYDPIEQKKIDADKGYSISDELEADVGMYGKYLEKNLEFCLNGSCCGPGTTWNKDKKICDVIPTA